MAIRVKDTAAIARKFVTRAAGAAGDYTEGVRAAGQDWAQNAAASAENFALGVQQAIADNRFRRGVEQAGPQKYVERASTLGAQRYPTGVQAAEGAFAREAAPFLDTIRNLSLPPRRPKGDPANMQRAAAVAEALRKAKVGR